VRVTIPKVIAATAVLALTGYVFVLAPHLPGPLAARAPGPRPAAAPRQARPYHPAAAVFPAAGKKFVGIMTTSGPYNFGALDKFTAAVGHQPRVYEFSQGWAVNPFNAGIIDGVARRGMLPMISWEPWNYHLEPTAELQRGYQPAYTLARIIHGRYDRYIRSWAQGVKSLGYPVAIRFAHEMNGYWYPWGIDANGNKVGQYVLAWRHVHDIFARLGARNVIWVWSPNVIWNRFTDLRRLYPGNAYVNWVGLSGYYGTLGVQTYESFNKIFDRTLANIRKFARKPVVITETGATPVSGLMGTWITQMFRQLPSHPDIIGVIWYEAANIVDFQVTDDPAAGTAFRAGAASPRYRLIWTPSMQPASGPDLAPLVRTGSR